MAERCGDRPLGARLDLEERQRQALSFLRESPRGRRQSFALRERTLERLQSLAGDPGLFAQRLAFRAHARVEHTARTRELRAQPIEQRLGALAPQLQPLARAAQAVERRRGLLAAAGGVGQLLFGAPAFLEQRVEFLVGVFARQDCGSATSLAVLQSFAQEGQVELRNARAKRRDLAAQLLGALGCRRLQRERTQTLFDLRFDVARTLYLHGDPPELQLGAVLALLEAPEPRRFLEQLASLLRLRAEDLLDAPLADDGVHPAAEPEIGEQLDEVDAANRRAVEEVLTLAAAMQPACDRQLRVGQRPFAVGIVEQELDLAELLGRTAGAPREEDVVRLLGAQLRRGERARRPDDRVGDVRLPGAVRPDDHGDARLEANLDRIRERLEAAQLYGA
jgi:hypothetical protein